MPLPLNSKRNKKRETSFPAKFFKLFIALPPLLRTSRSWFLRSFLKLTGADVVSDRQAVHVEEAGGSVSKVEIECD